MPEDQRVDCDKRWSNSPGHMERPALGWHGAVGQLAYAPADDRTLAALHSRGSDTIKSR